MGWEGHCPRGLRGWLGLKMLVSVAPYVTHGHTFRHTQIHMYTGPLARAARFSK